VPVLAFCRFHLLSWDIFILQRYGKCWRYFRYRRNLHKFTFKLGLRFEELWPSIKGFFSGTVSTQWISCLQSSRPSSSHRCRDPFPVQLFIWCDCRKFGASELFVAAESFRQICTVGCVLLAKGQTSLRRQVEAPSAAHSVRQLALLCPV